MINDIDIIVLMDPRIDSSSSTFNHIDIDKYLKFKNKKMQLLFIESMNVMSEKEQIM